MENDFFKCVGTLLSVIVISFLLTFLLAVPSFIDCFILSDKLRFVSNSRMKISPTYDIYVLLLKMLALLQSVIPSISHLCLYSRY